MKEASYSHRALTSEDADMILAWRNQAHIRQYMYTDHVITDAEHHAWMQKTLPLAENYRIFLHDNRPIGMTLFYNVKEEHRNGYMAFYLGASDAPKGSGWAMEYMMLDYAFLTRKFHKLNGEVFCFNEKVIAMHKEFGWRQESLFKEQYLKNGKYEDVLGIALFGNEWIKRRDAMHTKMFRD